MPQHTPDIAVVIPALNAAAHLGTALSSLAAQDADFEAVLVDGGVRTGLDVVKMLALGARAVLVGRAWAWSVAAGGEAAVRNMLEGLRADIDVALALTGRTSVADLNASALYARGAAVGAPASATDPRPLS